MKLSHEDLDRFPAPMLAILVDAGYIKLWPGEITPAAARFVREQGWLRLTARALDDAIHVHGFVSAVGIGEHYGRTAGG